MNVRDVFPSTRSEIAAMCACYALTALLGWMVCNPRAFYALVIGG